jgi:hypothetical protein
VTLPLTPEVEMVTLKAVHACHPFWSTNTELINIPVAKVS